jgi:hypothetical protein
MLGRFALMLCPKAGCPKIGLAKDAQCPEHEVPMVRTIVMTEAAIKARKDISGLFDDVFKSMGGRR